MSHLAEPSAGAMHNEALSHSQMLGQETGVDMEETPIRQAVMPAAALLKRSSLRRRPGAMSGRALTVDKINPKAPAALSRFSFLIGSWACKARLKSAGGDWRTFRAAWVGRYIVDGYAIADEYRMYDAADAIIVNGIDFRGYDAATKTWNLKWLNALSGAWTDLSPEEFDGPSISKHSISYYFMEPVAAHIYTRATYTNSSRNHFTWVGEQSNEAKSWTEFMRVECDRASN